MSIMLHTLAKQQSEHWRRSREQRRMARQMPRNQGCIFFRRSGSCNAMNTGPNNTKGRWRRVVLTFGFFCYPISREISTKTEFHSHYWPSEVHYPAQAKMTLLQGQHSNCH